MDLIKVKQLEYSLNYLDKRMLEQSNEIVWAYNDHLLTFNSFNYLNDDNGNNTYPIFRTEMNPMGSKPIISYLNTGSKDIFSLARDASIRRFFQGFDISKTLKEDHLILLNELIKLVNDIEVTDNEISKVESDVIYNVKYLDIPDINFNFMKVDSNSDFEPISIISTSKN